MADSSGGTVDRRPSDPQDLESKYTVDMHVFPPSLGWLKEHENYVAFYINVPAATAASIDSSEILGDVAPIEGTFQGGENALFKVGKPYKRLKTAIVLPIMERPVAKYGADWDMTALGPVLGWAMTHTADTGSPTGIADTLGRMWGDATRFAGNEGLDALKAIGLSTLNAAAGVVGLGGDASTADLFQIIRRTALNEHRTQMFKSIRFRNFDFEYRFSPRDAEQANIIKTIIQTFKYHMHPDVADSNLFLTYPSEFDIVFYFKDKENVTEDPKKQNLFKISTCALTDFQVHYGGDKFFTFDDGMPTEITMQMSFLELELLTKKRIKEGF